MTAAGAMALLFTACGGGGTEQPPPEAAPVSTAVSTQSFLVSASCPNGGHTVSVGIDDNRNGVLDATEVDASYDICNGTDGASSGTLSLIETTPFSGATNGCPAGGVTIRTGLDTNGNGILDTAEAPSSDVICNGVSGKNQSNVSVLVGLPQGPLAPNTVGANGRSTYNFTVATPGPYSLVLIGLESMPLVKIYSNAAMTAEVPSTCDLTGPATFVCAMASLAAQTYYVSVEEQSGVANEFFMFATLGITEGSWDAPRVISGSLPISVKGSVGMNLAGFDDTGSMYAWTNGAGAGVFTLTLSGFADLDPNNSPQVNVGFHGSNVPCRTVQSMTNWGTESITCTFDANAGETVQFEVKAQDAVTYTIGIASGDGGATSFNLIPMSSIRTSTAPVASFSNVTGDRMYKGVAPASGAITVETTGCEFQVYRNASGLESPPVLESKLSAFWNGSFVESSFNWLTPGETFYVVLHSWNQQCNLYVYDNSLTSFSSSVTAPFEATVAMGWDSFYNVAALSPSCATGRAYFTLTPGSRLPWSSVTGVTLGVVSGGNVIDNCVVSDLGKTCLMAVPSTSFTLTVTGTARPAAFQVGITCAP